MTLRDEEALAAVIYEALCASTDPGTSAWYRSIDRPEYLITARAVLAHLHAQRSPAGAPTPNTPQEAP
jgi:hypothetical protein